MIRNAMSIRFSSRIKNKANLSLIKVSAKKKIRKAAVNKRTFDGNYSLLKAKEKVKVGRKRKSEESSKQTSKLLKQTTSCSFKPVIAKISRKNIPKICNKTRKTRNSVNASQVALKNHKVCLKNLDLSDDSKKVVEKKNYKKKFVINEEQYVRRSFRLSNSSPLSKGESINKELNNSDLKTSGKRRLSKKKSLMQVIILSSKSVLTPNPKYSERRKSMRLSKDPLNQEIVVNMSASKSFVTTPVPEKVTAASRYSEKRRSVRLSKDPNKSILMNSEISLHTSSFQSPSLTPKPEKYLKKRKSSRLLETSSLKTLNKGLSVSASLPARNPDSISNKSSKSFKRGKLLSSESCSRKPNKPKESKKDIHSVSHDKQSKKQQVIRRQKTSENVKIPLSSEIENLPLDDLNSYEDFGSRKRGKPKRSNKVGHSVSSHMSPIQSFLETPQPEKYLEKRKSSRSFEASPLKTLNKELSTPASLPERNPDSTPNRSLKSCKRGKLLSSESCSRKPNKPKESNKDSHSVSHEKRSKKQQINQSKKSSENFKNRVSNETENLPLDDLRTSVFKTPCGKNLSRKYLLKSDSKSSKRKFSTSASEELQDAKKQKKSTGHNVCVDNSTSPSKCRSMKKSKHLLKIHHTKKLKNNLNNEDDLMLVINPTCKIDVLTFNSYDVQSRERVRSMPSGNKINCLSSVYEKMGKSAGILKRKKLSLIPHALSCNVNNASTEKTIKKEASEFKTYSTKKHNFKTPQVSLKNNFPMKEDCLTADLCEMKHKRGKPVPGNNDKKLLCEIGISAFQKRKFIKTLSPIAFTPNVNLNSESSLANSAIKKPFQIPPDDLTTNESASCSQNGDSLVVNKSTLCYVSKKKTNSWSVENECSSKVSSKDDFPKIPTKGTLKHKRWLLNNLKEKNGGYEDDIFENQNFDRYKPAFHFGYESDGSSVNIATPKFDCILTPAVPKKTPRFKDCISPTEFLEARKTAEEYLHRRNKKRKSGDRPSSSGKKTSMNKKNTVQNIPEKKKLDFEEAVNKLIEVQKNLEIEAEADNDEDFYFSDESN